MTSYTPGAPALTSNLDLIELRVISNILQRDLPAQAQDELRILRNDQAFELGIVPPVVIGN
jgi:hypothetical protein